MRKPEYYSAVYWIIRNSKWEILFQKRQNTGFRDWCFQIPSWHIEWKESMEDALIREMKEEINIELKKCELIHISHRISKDERVYFDCYFKILEYTWEIRNLEPDKCSELTVININEIKEKDLFWYDLDVIKKIEKWEKFSEVVL